MTIDLETKLPVLKTFHEIIYQKGWNFDKSKQGNFQAARNETGTVLFFISCKTATDLCVSCLL